MAVVFNFTISSEPGVESYSYLPLCNVTSDLVYFTIRQDLVLWILILILILVIFALLGLTV